MNRIFVVIAFVALAALTGCGKGSEAPKDPAGDAGKAGGQAAKADLSSAKSAFEGFATRVDDMKNSLEEKFKSVFFVKESELYAPAITQQYAEFLKEREKKFDFSGDVSKEGKFAFEKEEQGQGGETLIYALQKNTRTERTTDETGKTDKKTVETEVKHKLHFQKIGDEWRIVKWFQSCGSCKGSGKCGQCEGTGKTKPEDCYGCQGKGKDEAGEKCTVCEGSGKTKPQDCFSCKSIAGKCSSCKGEGWRRQDEFESGGMISEAVMKVEKFSDMSTPENAVKALLNLRDQHDAKGTATAAEIAGSLRSIIVSFFSKETNEKFEKSVKESTDEAKRDEADRKREFEPAKIEGDIAIASYVETRKDKKGKEHKEKKAFKLVKKDGSWKIDDRGRSCWSCEGAGKCPQCKGTGKTDDGDCYACQADKGLCSPCKGGGYSWDRAQRE